MNGSLKITPAAENAYNDQVDSIRTIILVIRVGLILPCSESNAICFPAPKNRYQEPPKYIQPKCKVATTALNIPAIIRKTFIER